MNGTPFLRTAYDGDMQPIAILVILMLMQQPDLGASMQKFLQFYRENRALIAAIAGEGTTPAPPPEENAQKDRPEEGGPDKNVLEEYLKNACVR